MLKRAERRIRNSAAGSHGQTQPPPRTAAAHQERALGIHIYWEDSDDVPLIINPVQPFRVLRVSLRGCGRLVALSGPRSPASGCSRTSPWSHIEQKT
ncbi:hypothetical protein PIB30_053928 [Stylosanthes scabra]|uniref:Uncharacterized protein n=1 Tax=Stylosanthes scabra TaxID=79078 RepID=A0ABU6RIQ1_9FABA|nr:hypothetical protein [Stylosanthes scabra]